MRYRPNKFNDTPTIEDAWWDEMERFELDDEDFDIANCAELADELELFRIQADGDDGFIAKYRDWFEYIAEYQLWLPLEQCCFEGVLLPVGQRERRVSTCPREVLGHLSYFFSRCPVHAKHYLALDAWILVRLERVRRTGNPEWRPNSPPAREPYHDTVFFRPPILKFRNYAR